MKNGIFAFVLIFCVLVVWTPIQAAPIEGLVLYMSFDEGKGDEVVDLSGNGNDGIFQGEPIWVEGKSGTALQFSGEENKNYVEIADSPSLNPKEEITALAWISSEEFKPTGGIISKYIGANNQRSYDLHMNHDIARSINAGVSSNGAFQVGVSTTTVHSEADSVADGQWSHVAMTFKAKEFLRVYVNGEMKAESDAAATESIFDNDVPLYIGTDFAIGGAHNGQPREFTGVIDEVAIFNRVLSDDEIQNVMNGMIMPVEAPGKLTATWGRIKGF